MELRVKCADGIGGSQVVHKIRKALIRGDFEMRTRMQAGKAEECDFLKKRGFISYGVGTQGLRVPVGDE